MLVQTVFENPTSTHERTDNTEFCPQGNRIDSAWSSYLRISTVNLLL